MKFFIRAGPADPKSPNSSGGCCGGSNLACLAEHCAGPLFAGAFASDKIWHSEKIRCACKFSLCSVCKGFADLELFASPHCCWLTALPLPHLGLSTLILLKITPLSSPGAPISLLGEEEKGLGLLNLSGGWLPLPEPHFPWGTRGCNKHPQPCEYSHRGRRGCCYHKSGGSTFPNHPKLIS